MVMSPWLWIACRYDKNGHSAHVVLGKGWHIEEQCAVVASKDVRSVLLENLHCADCLAFVVQNTPPSPVDAPT